MSQVKLNGRLYRVRVLEIVGMNRILVKYRETQQKIYTPVYGLHRMLGKTVYVRAARGSYAGLGYSIISQKEISAIRDWPDQLAVFVRCYSRARNYIVDSNGKCRYLVPGTKPLKKGMLVVLNKGKGRNLGLWIVK